MKFRSKEKSEAKLHDQEKSEARWQNLCWCSPILCFPESNARRVVRKWGDAQRRLLSCGRGLGGKPPIFFYFCTR